MPDTAPARWVPIDSIREWEQNPKRHDDANVHQIATSIKRHGFTAPILVWGSKRRIVAGHGRYRGAQLLLRQDPGALLALDAPAPGQVLIREIEFASESEAAAYALADNRLTEANPMHAPDVAEILRQIEEEVGRVEVAGYSEADIEAILAALPTADEWADGMAKLPTEDREPIQAMTFTLHDEQAATVKRAMEAAKALGPFVDTGNENSNGNALARICETFLTVSQ
jgi:ParB-like chromosome segregation protein Spo0J